MSSIGNTRNRLHQEVRCLATSSSNGNALSRNGPKRDPGLDITSVISHPKEVPGPKGVPSRAEQLRRLKASDANKEEAPYDILVIGAGATGAGIAMDAALRGLNVACIERGDFGSETSSRSTKLIWAGIKYMATASAALLSPQLFTSPITTVKNFWGEMKMVFNCHTERNYMMVQQEHLCNWIPIAIPFDRWHVSPPPFKHALFGFFPILAPAVLKFYDSLSFFKCPPSYIMTPQTARQRFPQLDTDALKYCAVFYEAQHNDSRTNQAIAMTAAEHGAHIANYVEMTDTIKSTNGKVIGIQATDRMTGETFPIYAKKVVFAGGPFTDSLRQLEHHHDDGGENSENQMRPAVRGASGIHIVIPKCFCPSELGMLDYNTSDGRFLFFLPWENHTLVGTTDRACPAETLPTPPEDEIEWLLKECQTYLRDDITIRRSDVLSAWQGWRPLAADPHAPPGAPASRDHVISENPESGVIFIAGGKWTTWREMAQEVVDRVVGDNGPKCKTLETKLFGGDGFTKTIPIQLIQKYGLSQDVADHLSRSYGARAWEVMQQHKEKANGMSKQQLVEGFPYLEDDVRWACREVSQVLMECCVRPSNVIVRWFPHE